MTNLKEHTKKSYLARIHCIFGKAIKPYTKNLKILQQVQNIKNKKEPQKVRAITKREVESLFSIFTKQEHQLFVLISGTYCLRCGEVLGLTWQDGDFKNNTIDINKQWKRYNGKKHHLGELKTAASYSVVPLPPRTKYALQQYKKI